MTSKNQIQNALYRAVLASLIAIPFSTFADTLFSTDDGKGNTIFCHLESKKYIAGRMIKNRFSSNTKIAAGLKALILKTKKKPALTKLKKDLKDAVGRRSKEDKKCTSASQGAVPNPGGSPTPTPNNFDSNGNTTAFGIPSGTTGNISRGQTLYQANCLGCHDERRYRSYTQVSSARSLIDAMKGIAISAQEQADIVAFLNR